MADRKLNVIVIALLFNLGASQVYRCSKSGNCVFPFTHNGKTYNECTTEGSSTGWYWCKTDGPHGWAYCDICEEDKVSSTTTTTTTTTTTSTTTTTTAAVTSTTVSKLTSLSPTAETTTTTTKQLTPSRIRTTSAAATHALTTTKPKSKSATKSMEIAGYREGTKASPSSEEITSAATFLKGVHSTESVDEDEFDSNTTPGAEGIFEATSSKSVTSVLPQNASAMTPGSQSTTPGSQPTFAQVCTTSGKPCQLPFEYNGEMHYSCLEGLVYKLWCYTDSSIEEYSQCVPCKEIITSTTVISTIVAEKPDPPMLPQENTPVISVSTAEVLSKASSLLPRGRSPVVSVSAVLSANRKVEDLQTSGTTQSPFQSEAELHEQEGTNTVTIMVLVLCAAAVIIILIMTALLIRRLRNPKKADGGKYAGESGEVLLSGNKESNHKCMNDGNSQEMKSLNSKCDVGPGGDCGVRYDTGARDIVNVVTV